MSRLIFRINPRTDGDIIAYLEKQPNRSDAIRQAIRLAIKHEENINEMMYYLTNPPVDDGLEIGSIEWCAREVIRTGKPINNFSWLVPMDYLPLEEIEKKIHDEIVRIREEERCKV